MTDRYTLDNIRCSLGSDSLSFYQHVFLQDGGLGARVEQLVYNERLALKNPDLPLLEKVEENYTTKH